MKLELSLKTAHIPRNAAGDPAFGQLTSTVGQHIPPCTGDETCNCRPGVLDVFTHAEVVELVNRALYQLEYQRMSHAKRQREQTDLLRPVKLAAKRVLNLPYSKLTTDQINTLLGMLKENPQLGEEDTEK